MENTKPIWMVTALALVFAIAGCGSDMGPDEEVNGEFFSSGLLGPDESFSHTFEETGTFNYYCTTHAPNMTGQIIVSQEASATERDTVIMENQQFNPSQLTVAPNTEVVWINREAESVDDHTVTSGTPGGGGPGYEMDH